MKIKQNSTFGQRTEKDEEKKMKKDDERHDLKLGI